MEQGVRGADDARHRLYEIMKRDAAFEEKAADALALGTSYLGVEAGFVSRITPATDHHETIVSTAETGPLSAGTRRALSDTYCKHTLERDSPLAMHDVDEFDDIEPVPTGLSCYHGSTLTVDGEPFGTVCFASPDPRDRAFDDAETMFAELVGRLLEHELEHRQQQDELARRTSLVNVLDRVLRHNIRNDMTIVRAHAQIQRDTTDCERCQAIIETADDLVEMSETAREVSKLLNLDQERERVDVAAVARAVADEVGARYPAASVAVEAPDSLVIEAFPTLDVALRELVENAAEHGGEAPVIEIAVTGTTEGVELRVRDDGPGLPEVERATLQAGAETQLVHGSGLGLWTVYWVVASHRGTIAIDTDDGTTVTVEIPRSDVEGETTPRVEPAADRYRAAFEHVGTGMLILEGDSVVELNDRAADLFGRPRESVVGRSIGAFLEEDWPGAMAGCGTVRLRQPDGDVRRLEFSVSDDIAPDVAVLSLHPTGAVGSNPDRTRS